MDDNSVKFQAKPQNMNEGGGGGGGGRGTWNLYSVYL